jgi:hypothetical protein
LHIAALSEITQILKKVHRYRYMVFLKIMNWNPYRTIFTQSRYSGFLASTTSWACVTRSNIDTRPLLPASSHARAIRTPSQNQGHPLFPEPRLQHLLTTHIVFVTHPSFLHRLRTYRSNMPMCSRLLSPPMCRVLRYQQLLSYGQPIRRSNNKPHSHVAQWSVLAVQCYILIRD